MFPLRDHRHTYKFPLVTYLIIVINAVVFFLEITAANQESFITQYALIPIKVDFSDLTTLYPFITSQFLHAGFLHIISNMWFLRIFGDNVEEKMGSTLYLFVYLLSGVVGGLAQYMLSPNLNIPMLGASGAVAGVLGAYLVFYPHHKIDTLVFYGFFTNVVAIPASVMLLYWFAIQLFSGVGSVVVSQTGGVAFWAHVGGFAVGWIFAKLYPNSNNYAEEGEILS